MGSFGDPRSNLGISLAGFLALLDGMGTPRQPLGPVFEPRGTNVIISSKEPPGLSQEVFEYVFL